MTTDEKGLRQKFSFEKTIVELDDESFFRPNKESKARWYQELFNEYRAMGRSVGVLYCLNDDTFVWISASPTRAYRQDWLDSPELIECAVDEAMRLDRNDAVRTLMNWQVEIPEELAQYLESPPRYVEPEPRPLATWAGQRTDVRKSPLAHEVRVHDLLHKIYDKGVHAVQWVRKWSPSDTSPSGLIAVADFANELFARYRVDPKQWKGAESTIPPADVDILKMRWPMGIEAVRSATVPRLRELIDGPCSALYFSLTSGESPGPTDAERTMACQALIQSLQEIETLLVSLKKTLEELDDGTVSRQLEEDESTAKNPPEPEHYVAYFLELSGKKQSDIAKKYRKNAGTISRWIRGVTKWHQEGNPIPTSIDDIAKFCSKPISLDPSKIELGESQSSTTPRQRRRKEPD